jgi:hypothetical protein
MPLAYPPPDVLKQPVSSGADIAMASASWSSSVTPGLTTTSVASRSGVAPGHSCQAASDCTNRPGC